MASLKNLATLFGVLLISGCATDMIPVKTRPLSGPGELQVHSRPLIDESKPDDIYGRKRDINIVPKSGPSETGSLYRLGDHRNQLFTEQEIGVGSFVDVGVKVNRQSGQEGAGNNAGAGAPSPAAGATAGQGNTEEDLTKALPNLAPAEANPHVIKKFPMRITAVLDNGDFLALYSRTSKTKDEAHQLNVKARIPAQAMNRKEPLTTDDLLDVEWMESRDGDLVERQSSGWEDEYTLRMSGFNEARSRMAVELEDKRKQLEGVKKQLQTRIETLGSERRGVSKERDRLAKEKTALEQKEKELGVKVSTLEDKVKEQEEIIKDMQSKEKQADAPVKE